MSGDIRYYDQNFCPEIMQYLQLLISKKRIQIYHTLTQLPTSLLVSTAMNDFYWHFSSYITYFE